jgi:hypothetical protein
MGDQFDVVLGKPWHNKRNPTFVYERNEMTLVQKAGPRALTHRVYADNSLPDAASGVHSCMVADAPQDADVDADAPPSTASGDAPVPPPMDAPSFSAMLRSMRRSSRGGGKIYGDYGKVGNKHRNKIKRRNKSSNNHEVFCAVVKVLDETVDLPLDSDSPDTASSAV